MKRGVRCGGVCGLDGVIRGVGFVFNDAAVTEGDTGWLHDVVRNGGEGW